MPPRAPTPPPHPALVAALGLGLLASIVIALRPGPTALFPALTTLVADVAAHDSETLRREHDGWYARLLPVYTAIEALPADDAILLSTHGVPTPFVAARFPGRRVFADSDALRAELTAQQQSFHLLTLTNGDPLGWTLVPGGSESK